jgi:hypothetical protein
MVFSAKTKKKNQKQLVEALFGITRLDESDIKFKEISWDAEKPILKFKGLNETPDFTITFVKGDNGESTAFMSTEKDHNRDICFKVTRNDIRRLTKEILTGCSLIMLSLGINCFLANYEGDYGLIKLAPTNRLLFLASTKVSFEIDIETVTEASHCKSADVPNLPDAILIATESGKSYFIALEPIFAETLVERINQLLNTKTRAITANFGEVTHLFRTKLAEKYMDADQLKKWEKRFRSDARADNYALFHKQLQKLELQDKPQLMLDGTIRVMQAIWSYANLDGRPVDQFLDMQQYDHSKAPDARYSFTFDLHGKAFARILADAKLVLPDLADLYNHPWNEYKRVGYCSVSISHPDWSPLTKQELEEIENEVTNDLRFDYTEDEVDIWFDARAENSHLFVEVSDVEEGENEV